MYSESIDAWFGFTSLRYKSKCPPWFSLLFQRKTGSGDFIRFVSLPPPRTHAIDSNQREPGFEKRTGGWCPSNMMISSRTSLRCSISVPMGGSTAVRLSRRLLHQRIIHYHPLPCGCGHRVPFWSISIPEIAVDGGGAVQAWRRRRQHRRGLSFPKTTDAARTLSMLSSWLSVSLASLSSTRTKVWNAPRIPVVSHCHFASSASTPAGEEGLTAGHTNASLPAGVTAPSSNTGNSLPEPAHNRDARLIDFQVAAKIEGEESQIVTIQIEPGETLRAEAGNMLYMTEGVVMDTTLGGASGSAFTRFLTGQNIFLTDFTYQPEQDTQRSGKGIMALGTEFPAKLLRLSLDQLPEQSLICQRGAYLASNPTVNIEMEFTKTLTAGFFGGQGFILQRLTGVGDVIVKGGGPLYIYISNPANPSGFRPVPLWPLNGLYNTTSRWFQEYEISCLGEKVSS